MRSMLRSFPLRLVRSLVLLLSLLMLAVSVPVVALAASDDEQTAVERPVLSTCDEARRPTVVGEMDEARQQYLASLAAEASTAGSDAHIATLSPWVFFDAMEGGAGSWTADAPWALTTEWQPTWMSPDNDSWSDSPGGNYANGANTSLFSGIIDLSAAGAGQLVSLSFAFQSELEVEQDYLWIEFSPNAGSNWYWYGDYISQVNSDGWFWAEIPAAMYTNQFMFRLRLQTNGSTTYDGVHVDYVGVDADYTDLVEEDDARLGYLGSWTDRTAVDEWGGTWGYRATSTSGDAVQVNFTGPAIMVLGKKGLDGGIAQVALDDGPVYEVDFYSDNPYDEMNIAWVTAHYGLTDGPHTLTICCTGTKNPASWGYSVTLEEALIWGTVTGASGPDHNEDDSTYLEYGGPWVPTVDPAAFGGTLKTLDARGSVNVAFTGNYLVWNAKKGPGYGKAKVSIDGGPLQTVDLYNAWDSSKRRVYNTGLLENGFHEVAIYWSGEKNTSSWGTKIDVDWFDTLGYLKDADSAPPMEWRYQQDASVINYLGDWTITSTWSASGGSFASTAQTGAAAVATFTGTEVSLLARTTPWYGEAEIFIDGEYKAIVDLYSPSEAWKVPIYTNDSLSDDQHVIGISCKGTKNPSSWGTSISLDALDIVGYLDEGDHPMRYHDSDTNLAYVSSWDTLTGDWSYSNSDFSSIDEAGAVTVKFYGTYLEWYGRTTPWYGKAKVVLDEDLINAVTVDLYSTSIRYKQRLYGTGLLEEGKHTLTIYWLGDKNPASLGTRIGVDSFDMLGYPVLADPAPPISLRYQQSDPKITYVGTWSTGSTWSASGGSFASTAQAGASAFVKFHGTGVALLSRTTPWYGKMDIYVDGAYWITADLYSSSISWKVPVFQYYGFSDGDHAIAVCCTGDKNVASAGSSVCLDAVDVTGSLQQAPTTARIQEDDSGHCTPAGVWSPSGDTGWQASGNSFLSTQESGATMTFKFHGTYASLLSRTTPWYGEVEVRLYYGAVLPANLVSTEVVDLYSASTDWKKTVYSTGLLSDGDYNVVVECLHDKYVGSWGYAIAVDAFDAMMTTP